LLWTELRLPVSEQKITWLRSDGNGLETGKYFRN
jgi:hypothetical protein